MICKKIGKTYYDFGIEFDIQQVANDLDVSVADMRYIDRNSCNDGITSEGFDRLVSDIRSNAAQTSYDDNTELYYWNGSPVIVCTQLYNQIIIFEKEISLRVENAITQL